MQTHDTIGTGRLDKNTFKKAMKQLSVAMTDSEIQRLVQDLGFAVESRQPGKKT